MVKYLQSLDLMQVKIPVNWCSFNLFEFKIYLAVNWSGKRFIQKIVQCFVDKS